MKRMHLDKMPQPQTIDLSSLPQFAQDTAVDVLATLDELSLPKAKILIVGGAAMRILGFDRPVTDIDVAMSPDLARQLIQDRITPGGQHIIISEMGGWFRSTILQVSSEHTTIGLSVDLVSRVRKATADINNDYNLIGNDNRIITHNALLAELERRRKQQSMKDVPFGVLDPKGSRDLSLLQEYIQNQRV